MHILRIIATTIGLIACVAIVVIALLEVAARHMSMEDLGSKILEYLVGVIIGVCIIVAFITLIDWAYSTGHFWAVIAFFSIVVIAFSIIMREEKE